MSVRIDTYALGDWQTNCYVVSVPPARECWIVDCGMQPKKMLDAIEREKLQPVGLLLTHAHLDHIAGVDEALARFGPLPMWIHEAEAGWCSEPLLNLSALAGLRVRVTEPQHLLKGGEVLELGASRWRVLHTPGHSPGGVCYVCDEAKVALVGDVLFAGSIGRIDFPTSDPASMARSLRDVMLKLPDDITIYPGHGPSSTIGRERRSNPYLAPGIDLTVDL